jgi:uncharacterized protein (DUF3820 family)
MDDAGGLNPKVLIQIVSVRMPFGKYKNTLISDLPISYLEWFQRKGFPQGNLGMLLSTTFEIKSNGLEYLLEPIKRQVRQ